MADSIKIGNLDISAFKVGSDDCKVYLGDTLLYPQGQPPTPSYKWLATYDGGSTSSAECDASSAITQNEISLTNLVDVQIGDCVTSIGSNAFSYCGGLTSINIPDSVTAISNSAFYSCTSLISATIGNSVRSIGQYAFYGCVKVEDIIIGSGITSISMFVFQYCNSLTSITCLATTPPALANANAFSYTNNCPIYVPSGSVDAYKSASGWSNYASRIQAIPNS